MSLWLAILCGVGPCFVWMWLLYRQDDNEAEPWPLVLLAMGLGGLSTLGVLWSAPWLEHLLAPRSAAAHAFLVTAIGEEGWKLLALLPLLFCAELDEPLDGAIYGAAVGLGFAGVENVLYAERGGDVALLMQRAFTATLLHAACSGCLGFCWAMGKFERLGRGRVAWSVAGLLFAVPLHGAYDLWLVGEVRRVMVSLLVVLPAALTLLALKVRWARARSREYHPVE